MASAAMPPPPSPLAHRRTKPSSSNAIDSSCFPRKMLLTKADTFHQPSSPSSIDDPVLSVAHLSKRSTTCTRSSFTSWLYSEREAVADVIADFEQTFSGARGSRPHTRRRSAQDFQDLLRAKQQQRATSPVDSGVGSSLGTPSEKGLSRALDKALELSSVKDSALGDSISGTSAHYGAGETLIQETSLDEPATLSTRPAEVKSVVSTISADKVASNTSNTRARLSYPQELKFIRYPLPNKKSTQPFLDATARRAIYKHLFAPLLADSRFEQFKEIVARTRKNKNLRCLRDIEQSLIKQPVTLSVDPSTYKTFGELSIQLVVDTYQHLSQAEQRRSTDRAYDNGYFLDLVQQVQQLAAHIGSSDTTVETGEQPTIDDEITLEGGLSESGNLAELVRWKDGQGISLRTGLPYVPLAGVKRSASTMADDAQFSARRKKGVVYPVEHLPCAEPGCDKVFSRNCDLAKHEKTHTRPFKCPEPTCKFREMGLPTEKELERHINDKHNAQPKMYHCSACEFSTKRESNCKQHMEKKHGIVYHRTKGSGKAAALTPKSTPKTPAAGYSMEPSPVSQHNAWDNNSVNSFGSPYQQVQTDFVDDYPRPLFPRRSVAQENFDFNAPIEVNDSFRPGVNGYPTPTSGVINPYSTPRTPAYSAITQSPMVPVDHNVPTFSTTADLLTPDSMNSFSRPGSNAHEMQYMMADPTLSMDMGADMNTDLNNMDLSGDGIFTDFQMIHSGPSSAFRHAGAENATLFPDWNSANQGAPEVSYQADQFDIQNDILDFEHFGFEQ